MLSPISYIAIAIIIAALVLGWTRKFIAAGALVLANVAVHILTAFGPTQIDACTGRFAARPTIHNELGLCAQRLYEGDPIAVLQLFTSMFVHGDLMHLVGNLFILLAFALIFEELCGPRRLIVIYLVTGLFAAMSQIVVDFGQNMLLIGASGAVAGITGAFAGSYPHMVLRLPIPVGIIFFVRMRVVTWAIMFALLQVVLQAVSSYTRALGGVAYAAHLGGLVAGLILGYYWIKRVASQRAHGPAVAVDLEALRPYAQDNQTRRALDEMEANVDEPEVFEVWAERFWQGARDPETGQRVKLGRGGKVVAHDGPEKTD